MAHVEDLLFAEHALDMIPVDDTAHEAALAAIDRNRDLTRYRTGGANCPQGFDGLPQAWNGVHARHDDTIGCRDDLTRPGEPSGWQIDQDQLIARRRQVEEGVDRRNIQSAKIEFSARRREDVQPACVAADENLEQLGVEPLRIVGNLLDLQARLDIE